MKRFFILSVPMLLVAAAVVAFRIVPAAVRRQPTISVTAVPNPLTLRSWDEATVNITVADAASACEITFVPDCEWFRAQDRCLSRSFIAPFNGWPRVARESINLADLLGPNPLREHQLGFEIIVRHCAGAETRLDEILTFDN